MRTYLRCLKLELREFLQAACTNDLLKVLILVGTGVFMFDLIQTLTPQHITLIMKEPETPLKHKS